MNLIKSETSPHGSAGFARGFGPEISEESVVEPRRTNPGVHPTVNVFFGNIRFLAVPLGSHLKFHPVNSVKPLGDCVGLWSSIVLYEVPKHKHKVADIRMRAFWVPF